MQQVKNALQELRRATGELGDKGVPKDLVGRLQKQSFAIANQKGQLNHYEKQLRGAGLGKGERPCWVKPDGTIEFLFDVVLTSNEIKMRENLVPTRSVERATLPMPATNLSEILPPREFLARTQPLYESSLADNCRFL